ncbi:MAG: hypothetical protein KF773_14025 [Deltaproteobacteria bacterium]|nr:hypothetical protein [Deltaproteobacteria bacterium]
MTYVYVDGSGNRFAIAPDRLAYTPVRPEHSSTGMYSGGDPADVALTAAQLAGIEELIRAYLADTAHHIADRVKGSGLLAHGQQQTLADMASPARAALEEGLRALLPPGCQPILRPRQ